MIYRLLLCFLLVVLVMVVLNACIYAVVMACRDKSKMRLAADEIRIQVPDAILYELVCKLDNMVGEWSLLLLLLPHGCFRFHISSINFPTVREAIDGSLLNSDLLLLPLPLPLPSYEGLYQRLRVCL